MQVGRFSGCARDDPARQPVSGERINQRLWIVGVPCAGRYSPRAPAGKPAVDREPQEVRVLGTSRCGPMKPMWTCAVLPLASS